MRSLNVTPSSNYQEAMAHIMASDGYDTGVYYQQERRLDPQACDLSQASDYDFTQEFVR